MHGSEITTPILLYKPRDRAWIPIVSKGVSPVKKIFKNLARHFAQYGQRMTENMGL